MAESKEEIEGMKSLIAKNKSFLDRLYRPNDSSRKFDIYDFVSLYGNHRDLRSYVTALGKDANDPDATHDLARLLTEDSRYFEQFDDSHVKARIYGDIANEHSTESMALYVQGNLDDFFKLYEDTDMLRLVSSVPLYRLDDENKGSEEHNRFVDLVNETGNLEEISKNPNQIRAYVDNKIADTPEWFQEVYSYFSGRPDHMQALFQEFSRDAHIDLQKALRTEDGRINMNKIEGVLRNGIDEALKEYENETHEGDKKDIWDANIRPIYLAIAENIYVKEKAKMRKDKSPERERRKKRRRKKGMRV